MNIRNSTSNLVKITVELFGTARIACECKQVGISVPDEASIEDVVISLAEVCPQLVGVAILDDLSGLKKSHTFNLNGTQFLDGEKVHLKPNDRLLLFSSQAGG